MVAVPVLPAVTTYSTETEQWRISKNWCCAGTGGLLYLWPSCFVCNYLESTHIRTYLHTYVCTYTCNLRPNVRTYRYLLRE